MKYIAMTSYLNNSSIYTEDGIVCHIPPEQPLLLDLRSCILGWRDSRKAYSKLKYAPQNSLASEASCV